MQDLQISIRGEITSSNFEEWKKTIIQKIDATPTELASDEDFAQADKTVNSYKLVEKRLDEVKQSALDQSRDITNLFDAIDEVKSRVRDVRLKLGRQVTQRKKEIRLDLIDAAIRRVRNTIQDKNGVFPLLDHSDILREYDFESAIKGKSSLKNAQAALRSLIASKVNEIDHRVTRVKLNESLLANVSEEYGFLFHDQKALLLKASDKLEQLIEGRIRDFKETEQARRQKEQEQLKTQKEEERGNPAAPRPPSAIVPSSPEPPKTLPPVDARGAVGLIPALKALAEGTNPLNGNPMPNTSVVNHVDSVRLIYKIIDELETYEKSDCK